MEMRRLCDPDFDRAGVWNSALTVYEKTARCTIKRVPVECQTWSMVAVNMRYECKDVLNRLCGKELSGNAMHLCMNKYRKQLSKSCVPPPLRIDPKGTPAVDKIDPQDLEHWRAFKPLDDSSPEMLIIQKWHAAVLGGDQAAVEKLRHPDPNLTKIVSQGIWDEMFKEQMKTTPSRLWAGPVKEGLPSGQSLELAGCSFVPVYGKNVRVRSEARIAESNGQTYVFIAPFVAVMGGMKDKCPM
jgi:hypothetical protein